MHSQTQLTLKVQLRDEATLDNFLAPEPQEAIIKAVRGQLASSGEPIIYLHGTADSGKSHLLQSACHLARNVSALYLPLSEMVNYPPADVLQGVDSMNLVCLDDIHEVAGNKQWEHALFHFFNRARESNCRLLVSANTAPRALQLELADLESRLSWGLVFKLETLDDERRKAILRFRAERRGLHMSSDVATYIVNRAPRTLGGLLELLDRLDGASLAQQRALSIPFIKSVLAW